MVLHKHAPLCSHGFFRLAKIVASHEQEQRIQLNLFQTPLQHAPKYEALSYEWGTDISDQSVLCDGQELTITTNLAAALTRLRLADGSRCIWIDAICIDQTNLSERSQQVSIMRDIYARADRVLIWIGDEITYLEQAFDIIKAMARLWQIREVARLKARDIRPPLRSTPSSAEKMLLHLRDRPTWDAIFVLFSSTYFQRTWIIQEIAMSTCATVMCGRQQISWKFFHWAASFIGTTTSLLHEAPDTKMFGTIPAIAKIKSMSEQSSGDPLSLYLRFVQASRCSDPRDKVFGLLGLRGSAKISFPRLAESKLPVNYSKSVQQVYQDAAEYIILSQQDLEICYAHSLRSKTIEGLPSWVPDWSVREEGAPAAFLITNYKVRHSLSGKITFGGNAMYVDGYTLDHVNFTTRTMSCETPLPDIKNIILQLCESSGTAIVNSRDSTLAFLDLLLQLHNTKYKNGQSVLEALWRTLIGNTADFEPARPEFVRHFYAVLDTILLRERGIEFDRHRFTSPMKLNSNTLQCLLNDGAAQKLWQSAQDGESGRFFAELVNTIHGRVFFTTSRGYMGFGAMGAKVGDQVCVLGGGYTLFILRKHNDHFEMIGDAYLHGMMEGEVLELGRPTVKRFKIC